MPKCRSLFPTNEGLGLATDLYELTMAAGYFDSGKQERAAFELHVRRFPEGRSYLLAAGLEQACHYLEHLRFSARSIQYLRRHPAFAHVSEGFFAYLSDFRFTGDLWAMPEGTVFFPGEPVLTVVAPLPEAQVVETYLLSTINYQTIVATKASRIVDAAQGLPVVDFGSRRAHGFGAAMLAARAGYIAGCASTSNVLAARELGIPAVGTAAHSWTMAFDSEQAAFDAYQRVFPDSTTLLIDTYDTLEGARRAARLKGRVRAVRLDSGDLVKLSKQVRRILDSAGAAHVGIVASGDLNEHKIHAMLKAGAPITAFGVDTEMVTSRDDPAIAGVYKLVEIERDGKMVPRVKLSQDKATYPCQKQVFRQHDAQGLYVRDVVGIAHERLPGEPLLGPVMQGGKLIAALPSIDAIRERGQACLQSLPRKHRRLSRPVRYSVALSERLESALLRAQKHCG